MWTPWCHTRHAATFKLSKAAGCGNSKKADRACLQDTWKLDFVVMDENSGRYDNNKGQDFALPLAEGPSQEDVLQDRAASFQQAEQQRLQVPAAYSCGNAYPPRGSAGNQLASLTVRQPGLDSCILLALRLVHGTPGDLLDCWLVSKPLRTCDSVPQFQPLPFP